MNLMRIGKKVVNLDLVQEIDFCEHAPGVLIHYDGDGPTRIEGPEGVAAWLVIKRLCAHGETDPPSIAPDRLEELRGIQQMLFVLGDRPGGGELRVAAALLAEVIGEIERGR